MPLLHYSDVDKAKKTIKDYENAKTMGSILNGAMAISGAGAALGGFTDNKKILYPSMAGAFLSGFMKSRVDSKEQHALNKMKSMYDIRRAERSIEKQAVFGGALEAMSGVMQYFAHTPTLTELGRHAAELVGMNPELAAIAGSTLPFVADVAALPQIAKSTAKSTRDHAYVAAKDVLGRSLSSGEKKMRAISTLARSEQMAVDAMKPGFRKSFNEYFSGLMGPWGSGGRYGEGAGKALKEVGKWSPKYRELGLEAIKSDAGIEALKNTATKDFNTLHEAGSILNSTIDEIPLARKFLNATGRSGEGLAKKIIENPESAVAMANDFKHTVQKTVSGGRSLAIATGLMGAGYMIGKLRKRHPLSENELPSKILN